MEQYAHHQDMHNRNIWIGEVRKILKSKHGLYRWQTLQYTFLRLAPYFDANTSPAATAREVRIKDKQAAVRAKKRVGKIISVLE